MLRHPKEFKKVLNFQRELIKNMIKDAGENNVEEVIKGLFLLQDTTNVMRMLYNFEIKDKKNE